METKEIYRQVQELEANAKRYEAASKRFSGIAARIDELAEELRSLSKELDPFRATIGSGKGRRDNRAIYEELLEKMKNGVVVTKDLIVTTYQLENAKAQNIMNTLQRMSIVDKLKDGATVRLTMKGGTDA